MHSHNATLPLTYNLAEGALVQLAILHIRTRVNLSVCQVAPDFLYCYDQE